MPGYPHAKRMIGEYEKKPCFQIEPAEEAVR